MSPLNSPMLGVGHKQIVVDVGDTERRKTGGNDRVAELPSGVAGLKV
jgi:hypothetical protein